MNIDHIETWKKSFGVLPIHLFANKNDSNDFILLNGGSGDFCFSTSFQDIDPNVYNSRAWSSNTKNFVVLNSETIHLYNWKKSSTERIKKTDIINNFNKFYKYIVENSYKSNTDVVPFLIDIFKQFRNHTKEKDNAVEALNLLFTLLTSLEDEFDNTNLTNKWGLESVNIPSNFYNYVDILKQGTASTKPILDLILRHTSGVLFQEAQKEAMFFSNQLDLFGNFTNDIQTKRNLYTSIHYTPPYLSRTIVENTIKKLDLTKDNLKIIDPACGSGEFLIEVLKQLKEKNFEGNIIIEGWDSSSSAISTTSFLLNYEKRTIWKEQLTFYLKKVDDSLLEQWNADYDLILMNPPFISWELMDKNAREAVKSIFSIDNINTSKPNQASAFFYKAINSLNENGVIGCVMPSSLLTLDSYKKLRELTEATITFDLIGKLGNFIFEDALTDVSIILGHKPKEKTNPFILWVKNEKGAAQDALRDLRRMQFNNQQTINENKYSIYKPIEFPLTRENWKPLSFSENEMMKSLNRLTASNVLIYVNKIFNVKQGIRTGKNELFKITLSEYNSLCNNEKKYFRPVIDNDAIKNGKIFNLNYVWYPYTKEGLIILTESELRKAVPSFYSNTLEKNKDILSKRAGISSENWWTLTRHRSWLQEDEKRLISTEFGNSSSFAFDLTGKYAIERGNAWLPKKDFELDDYYFYLAFFSSNFFDKLLSIYSKQLAGANSYDLGSKYTSNIPIPNIFNKKVKNSDAYNMLINIGKEISEGRLYSKLTLDEVIELYFYNFN